MNIRLPCGCDINVQDDNCINPHFGWTYCPLHQTAQRMLWFIKAIARKSRGQQREAASRLVDQAEGRMDEDGYPIEGDGGRHFPHEPLEVQLAQAVIEGQDDALQPMVDELIEQGKLPGNINEAVKYRMALEACIDSCRRWSAGMDDIYEFIEARKLLGEIVEED